MDAELTSFATRIEQITSDAVLKRVADAGGMAAKKASLEAVSRDLGSDRSFSGLRRRAPLGVGFDHVGGSAVRMNYRPAGLWRLAEEGRRSQGTIVPRRRGGKRALLTPHGPRALSHYSSSRGLGTFSDAVDESRREAPKAAFRQFQTEIAKVVH